MLGCDDCGHKAGSRSPLVVPVRPEFRVSPVQQAQCHNADFSIETPSRPALVSHCTTCTQCRLEDHTRDAHEPGVSGQPCGSCKERVIVRTAHCSFEALSRLTILQEPCTQRRQKDLTRGAHEAGVSGQPCDSCRDRIISDCIHISRHPLPMPSQRRCQCGDGACWRSLPVVPMRPVVPVSPVAPADRGPYKTAGPTTDPL